MEDEKWKGLLKGQIAVNAYLDIANMFGWQSRLGWNFRIEDLVLALREIDGIKEIKAYYGLNEREFEKSNSFHMRMRKAGIIVKAKPVKFIRKTVSGELFLKRTTLQRIDEATRSQIDEVVLAIQSSGAFIEEPKCNFDVEMAMDMMDDLERVSAVMLFSGDSDFAAPLERVRLKGKKAFVVGVRGAMSSELMSATDGYIDFGKLYTGKRQYKSENPAFGGTA